MQIVLSNVLFINSQRFDLISHYHGTWIPHFKKTLQVGVKD